MRMRKAYIVGIGLIFLLVVFVSIPKIKNTTLIVAAGNGYEWIAKFALICGADANARDEQGFTPLIFASIQGELDMIELLTARKANVEALTIYGENALLRAVMDGHPKATLLLLKKGAKPNVSNHDGNTPLMMASRDGVEEVAKSLLKHGAHINTRDKHGKTALMYAAWNGRASMVKFLLARGANPTLTSEHGMNALQFAQAREHKPTIELLSKYKKPLRAP
jgi:ankyrin repeat protein